MPDRAINFYLSIDSFGVQSVRKQLDPANLDRNCEPIGTISDRSQLASIAIGTVYIIYYARSPQYDSIEINFGTLYKRTTAVVSCLVDIFMTILLLLMQTLFKHIGDAKNSQILLEVRR